MPAPPRPPDRNRSTVIQGYFPGGQARIPVAIQPGMAAPGMQGSAGRMIPAPVAQPKRATSVIPPMRNAPPSPAQNVAPLTRVAGPQGVVVQRVGNGEAFQLPANLSNFGGGVGQPLPKPVLQKMESFFKTTFADVRVHVGAQASSIGALAFTHGTNLYFAPGAVQPEHRTGSATFRSRTDACRPAARGSSTKPLWCRRSGCAGSSHGGRSGSDGPMGGLTSTGGSCIFAVARSRQESYQLCSGQFTSASHPVLALEQEEDADRDLGLRPDRRQCDEPTSSGEVRQPARGEMADINAEWWTNITLGKLRCTKP